MSSKGGQASSRKEEEVIAQQRKLAALLAKRNSTETKSDGNVAVSRPTKKATSVLHRKPTPQSSVAVSSKSIQNRPPENAPHRTIRPNLKRPSSASASAVLAAARAKVIGNNNTEETGKSPASIEVIEIKDSPKLQRQTQSKITASLLKNVAAAAPTNGDDGFSSASFASNITPEDFWKNIREWDLVSDLANQINEKDETVLTTKKPIPETFISFRHYISLWAPLCLAETRAQLISELLTSSSQQGSRAHLFISVDVETTWKTGRRDRSLHTDLTDMDACSVKLKGRERNKGSGQFFANDVFCLIPTECKDTVELLLSGKLVENTDNLFKRFCLVGHTEVQRKEVDGLILKVSKRKWAQVGTSSMYLLRIGGNITALREFTALCGVETIPLRKYLLGHHLEGQLKKDSAVALPVGATSMETATQVQKEALLKKMGGVQALGKGFMDYAQKKFNPSQLMAISASSTGCKSEERATTKAFSHGHSLHVLRCNNRW